MAHRKNKSQFRANSEEVQGEGSYVVLRRPTWEQMKDFANGDLKASEVGMELVGRSVLEWDWVDDDDNPLPTPDKDPSILARLPFEELAFLMKELGLDQYAVDQKN